MYNGCDCFAIIIIIIIFLLSLVHCRQLVTERKIYLCQMVSDVKCELQLWMLVCLLAERWYTRTILRSRVVRQFDKKKI